ncbi:MAG: acyl carrier protein [Puniceicoccales bacterium]|jgi:acyl carrier protein|nr:acyl carrier protein [Puniceicoccales bacterium]
MEKTEIYEQIKGHLVKLFDIPEEKITPEAHLFQDLGLDSIDAVDLAVQVQRVTGKKIKPEDFKTVRVVSDVVEAVHKLLSTPQ